MEPSNDPDATTSLRMRGRCPRRLARVDADGAGLVILSTGKV